MSILFRYFQVSTCNIKPQLLQPINYIALKYIISELIEIIRYYEMQSVAILSDVTWGPKVRQWVKMVRLFKAMPYQKGHIITYTNAIPNRTYCYHTKRVLLLLLTEKGHIDTYNAYFILSL